MESEKIQSYVKKEKTTPHSKSDWRQAEGGMNIKQTPFCQANAPSEVFSMGWIEVNTVCHVCQRFMVYDISVCGLESAVWLREFQESSSQLLILVCVSVCVV